MDTQVYCPAVCVCLDGHGGTLVAPGTNSLKGCGASVWGLPTTIVHDTTPLGRGKNLRRLATPI